MKTLCLLMISTNVEKTEHYKKGLVVNNSTRMTHIIDGLNSLFKYKSMFDENNIDICLADNTIKDKIQFPKKIRDILPPDIILNLSDNNKYGAINKGAGLIEEWRYLQDLISKYDWIIHFEPRQLIIDFNFFDSVIKSPRNLFVENKVLNVVPHFHTGLFGIESKILLKFINNTDINIMISHYISIEYMLYDFFNNENINYDTKDKLGLRWKAGIKDVFY